MTSRNHGNIVQAILLMAQQIYTFIQVPVGLGNQYDSWNSLLFRNNSGLFSTFRERIVRCCKSIDYSSLKAHHAVILFTFTQLIHTKKRHLPFNFTVAGL